MTAATVGRVSPGLSGPMACARRARPPSTATPTSRPRDVVGVSSSTPARSRGRAPATADVGIVESLIGGLLIGFALLIGACLRTIWQAPMWVITLGSAGAVVYLVETERLAWAILLVTLWLALLVLFSLIRPTWLAWLRDRYVGQALGLVVYRPRWETCLLYTSRCV